MAVDTVMILTAYYLALAFRFAGNIPESMQFHGRDFLVFAVLALAVHVTANTLAAVYTIVSRYVGLSQATRLAQAGLAATGILLAVAGFWPGQGHLLPLTVVLVGGLTATGAMIGVRFYARIFYERSLSNVGTGSRRVLLVGAGQAADMLLRETHRNPSLDTTIVGLVDDDPGLRNMRLHNHPVLGTLDQVAEAAERADASEILIAIPSATPDELTEIVARCRVAGLPIHTLPRLSELIDGRVSLAHARALEIQDLLGRPRIETDLAAIGGYLQGRRVLITGAGGSIGSEIARQVAAFSPAELVLLDRDESALYRLHEDLRARGAGRYEVVPVCMLQEVKVDNLFAGLRPHVVFHAAAYKHVPLMELHPDEAVINNVGGTRVVAEAAGRHGVERFVNISTDKAVDPVNVMGATKRVNEQFIRLLSGRYPGTRYCSVRFGNVLGSRGSVFPVFREQIAGGGPVTVTHPGMTRYFMMIEEAAQLVLQAAALVEEMPAESRVGGTVPGNGSTPGAGAEQGGTYGAFVLEMGAPVRIVDLAHKMIELLAPTTGPLPVVEYTGLRPGEKLTETLIGHGEIEVPTRHKMIRLAQVADVAGGEIGGAAPNPSAIPAHFEADLERLLSVARGHGEPGEILAALQACLPTYEPFDWSQVGDFPGAETRTNGHSKAGVEEVTAAHPAAGTAAPAAGAGRDLSALPKPDAATV